MKRYKYNLLTSISLKNNKINILSFFKINYRDIENEVE